jgi:hypothetical protein
MEEAKYLDGKANYFVGNREHLPRYDSLIVTAVNNA